MSNETSQGFGNVTDVQNLTGLNQAAMENETGGQQQSNQSAGGGQQQSNQTGNETGNQTGTVNETALFSPSGPAPENKR